MRNEVSTPHSPLLASVLSRPAVSPHLFLAHHKIRPTPGICCCCIVPEVVSHFLWPHELQHPRFLCPLSDSRPLIWWGYLSILPTATLCHPLLFLPSIFSNELALHMSWPKNWSFSICPSNEYSELIYLGLTGLTSLQSKGFSTIFCSTTIWKHQFFGAQPSLWSNSQICTWLLEKGISFNFLFSIIIMSVLYLC